MMGHGDYQYIDTEMLKRIDQLTAEVMALKAENDQLRARLAATDKALAKTTQRAYDLLLENDTLKADPEQARADINRETLAAVQHEIWADWMSHLFRVCPRNWDGTATIPAEKVRRWMYLVDTLYHELTEAEKVSDRHQADKIIAAVYQQLQPDTAGKGEAK